MTGTCQAQGPGKRAPGGNKCRFCRNLPVSALRDLFYGRAVVADEAAADATTHPNGPRTLEALRDAGVETILS